MDADADVVLFAAVAARTVHFRSQPRVLVRFCWGSGAGDTLRVVERRNLPTPVVAGVTYRDVYVAVELLGHLNAACLLEEIGLRAQALTAPTTIRPAPQCSIAGVKSAASTGATPRAPPE